MQYLNELLSRQSSANTTKTPRYIIVEWVGQPSYCT